MVKLTETVSNNGNMTLREHVTDQIDSLRRELKITWEAHAREHEQHELAHAREHSFAQTAIDKAAEMAKENKTDANEWRGSMNDRESKFATKIDVGTITSVLTELKEVEIKRSENERLRLIREAEDKRIAEKQHAEEKEDERDRQRSAQWKLGILIGIGSMFGSILINLVIRLTTN